MRVGSSSGAAGNNYQTSISSMVCGVLEKTNSDSSRLTHSETSEHIGHWTESIFRKMEGWPIVSSFSHEHDRATAKSRALDNLLMYLDANKQ